MQTSRVPTEEGEDAVTPPLAPRPSVVSALRRLLRPIVRLLLSNAITYPYLSDLLKLIFVETAEKEFGLGVRRLTDSRITLLTGVTIGPEHTMDTWASGTWFVDVPRIWRMASIWSSSPCM